VILQFRKHVVRSNGYKIEFARVYLDRGDGFDWIGEIEIAKGTFRSRFHQAFTKEMLRELLERWDSEAIA
jgi:hypothetical protein